MKEFKMNKKVKMEVARAVKEIFKNQSYSEVGIMYETLAQEFIVVKTGEIDRLVNDGYIHYTTITTLNFTDKKMTLENIANLIFN